MISNALPESWLNGDGEKGIEYKLEMNICKSMGKMQITETVSKAL